MQSSSSINFLFYKNHLGKYILLVNVSGSWLWRKKSTRLVLAWIPVYLEKMYKVSGIVDVDFDTKEIYEFSDQSFENHLDDTKNSLSLRNSGNLFIYNRKNIDLI
ncbi:MAG TPA: hypothetical protein EYQ84_04485 [Nitrospinaceae bacterium]|nr:hypothetical protein [Nitrospinaceae bacterium]